ncbi:MULTISPECIES: RNase P modulator RnpM [Bacillaceae]|uniref:COG2740 predicted nucleic-acid-binding protein implicated in transcription termination n=1 Tax=Mesobacillus selenatarsenatis (strain DSM 18680 / JCM 14380 / FERM P-15431 / SF-1) TaxID=1321606 RepID=A0A0A8X6G7_MESS1|nr:YlxR family protein [Mesobacillus selenatarsenatis]MBT2637098.1 YlxR family protein [Bacillus sp. ISL-39]MBT2660170.1 YlxR family protein [Bacillus sp. ISL-45]MBT2682993.1 YlxR family protein [Bacillus sp. ISL-37]GAM15565.1 COG2740 predicted nucleic-acid-binding protein implicated in transcription termination [Mesobacillus selenatarsenatis SF-1]
MNSRKKVPMRKCVATGEMRPKKELVRIVRSKEGEVSIDLTGKKSGRGAYLSKEKEAVQLAKKRNILSKQLETQVDDAIYDELNDLIEKESRLS